MFIRPYNTTDKNALVELLRLNTPQYFAPEEEQDFISYLENYIEQYFVIEEGGNILGCAGLNFTNNGKTAVLSWDIVHPESHGKGIGSYLTQYRIDIARKITTVDNIQVRTSQLTHNFYAKFGFKLRETVKDYWAPGFDMYFMKMSL